MQKVYMAGMEWSQEPALLNLSHIFLIINTFFTLMRSLIPPPPPQTTPYSRDHPEGQIDQVHIDRMLHSLQAAVPLIIDGDVEFGEDAEKRKPENAHDTIVDEAR